MVYGIQATGDTILTEIARDVAPEDKHRKSTAVGHKGENGEVPELMRSIDRATDGRGIRVYDHRVP